MKKDLSQMSERELLAELVADSRSARTRERVKLCLLAALLVFVLVLALIYLPRISATLRRVDAAMEQVQSIVDEINAVGTDKLTKAVEDFSATAEEARAFMDQLKDVELDKLQQSLQDLSDFTEKLRAMCIGEGMEEFTYREIIDAIYNSI